MSVRTTMLAAAALCLSLQPGAIAGTGAVGGHSLNGECSFNLSNVTLGGLAQYTFGGSMTSYSTVPASIQSIGTRATCTLISPTQPGVPGSPPTLSMSTDIRLSGPVAVTPPATTPLWPFRPTIVCVSGDAQFGPTPSEETMPQFCSGSLLPTRGPGGGGSSTAGWIACVDADGSTVCV